MTWTEERIADLMRMWTAGHSGSYIGNALGVSKSAVIGKAHRLKLPSRPSPIRLSTSPRKPKPAPMTKRVIKVIPKPILRAARPRNGAPACLWPIGDPGEADFHFCDAETVPGKPYCPEHCAQAYVARTRDDCIAA
jgi:GcrA cell cycle regulator